MLPKALVITTSTAATTLGSKEDTSMEDTDSQLITVS